MTNSFFLLSGLVDIKLVIAFLAITIVFYFFFFDRFLSLFEDNLVSFSFPDFFAEQPIEESIDALSEFTSLDESVFQVITDTKTTFADVAGNEEAKGELVEVVKIFKRS